MKMQQHKVHVEDAALKRLQQKLALADLPDDDSITAPWERGVPLTEITRLLDYWQNGFDWRKAENKINQFPQQMVQVNVEGFGSLQVHCIHKRSEAQHAIPLLFLHGWPGSFLEVTKMLPHLVKAEEDQVSFHVIAPSLINFGFSSGVTTPGFNTAKHAEAMHHLMKNLGYTQYVVQGGDVGYAVARFMALQYPESCRAHHVNMVVALEPSMEAFPDIVEEMKTYSFGPTELESLARAAKFRAEGMAYSMMHATRPQTMAYVLSDSPVGLLAWIYEKLHAWTDDYAWTDDEIITWVSIYYFSTAGPHASVRYYNECVQKTNDFLTAGQYISGKIGCSRFPKDVINTPVPWAKSLGDVVFDKSHEKGGHFAAWECPEQLAGDLREMFGRTGGAYGCVDT